MNDQARTELLASLAELSLVHPDWRLGQMLANVAMAARRLDTGAVWILEDDEALDTVKEMLRRQEHAENA